jgi:PAS domain S-box-containing protein
MDGKTIEHSGPRQPGQAGDTRLRKTLAAFARLAQAEFHIDSFLQMVTDCLLDLTEAATTVVEWVHDDMLEYRAISGANAQHLGLRLKIAGSLSGLCALTGEVLECPDADIDARVDAAACRRVGAASMVVAPLLDGGKAVAVLKLMSPRPYAFSAEDVDTLRTLSALAASAMAHQRAYSEKEQLLAERARAMTELEAEAARRRTADEQITELLQRRRAVLDTAQDAFVCIDRDGRITDWNNAATTIFGYTTFEAIGAELAGLVIPERYREAHRAGLQRYLRTGTGPMLNRRVELAALRRNGEEFAMEATITLFPVTGETQFACFIRDLTERRRAEDLDRRFRLLIQAVRDYAIFMLDSTGAVATWNSGAQAIKGYEADEILGRHFSVFYLPEDIARGWPQQELRIAAEQGRVEDEGWRVRKDGSVFWANAVITAVRDSHGMLQGFAKVTRDMTQRRRLEELELSSRRMNEFLAVLGHELRNPLAPIRNAVSILRLKTTDDPEVSRSRNIVDRQLAHLTRLVDDLLDAGRVMTGKLQLARQVVPIDQVIQAGVEGVQPHLDAKDQTLAVQASETVLHINADVTRMTQVLQNLLNNASKFSPRGETIRVSAFQDGSHVAVRVSDNGRGIHAPALRTIFDLFVQENAPGEQEEGGGLGIGLTLARTIVELHGGHIDVSSQGPGTGSSFTVRLPRVFPDVRNASPVRLPARPARGPIRVLVVDDNRDSADSMAMLLETLGHCAAASYDGANAVEHAQRFCPDAVLLDLSMPGMTGFEVLPKLRAALEPAVVTVSAMTGLGSDEDRRRTQIAGFDAHLTKPVDLSALVALLETVSGRPG